MADRIRKAVSKNKRRFENEKYNLDLTYITPKLIAMSFPGSGMKKLYRNSIDTVAQFMNEYHPGVYKLFNLSQHKYNVKKFNSQVAEFSTWRDHHSPPLDLLVHAWDELLRWMLAEVAHIGVVNWDAGKGRTGTFISCFLLYSRRFNDWDKAMEYFKRKRFLTGGGVTHPSQRRFVRYFYELIKERPQAPLCLKLNQITMNTAPHMNKNSSKVYLKIFHEETDKLLWKNGKRFGSAPVKIIDDWVNINTYQICEVPNLTISGGIFIEVFNRSTFSKSKICRFAFNMAFLPSDNVIRFSKSDLDPDIFVENTKVHDQFSINLHVRRGCECDTTTPIISRCPNCLEVLSSTGDDFRWTDIHRILAEYDQLDFLPSVLIFGDPSLDDIDLKAAGRSRRISCTDQWLEQMDDNEEGKEETKEEDDMPSLSFSRGSSTFN